MDYGKRGLREGEGSCLLKRGGTEQRKGEAKILKGKGGKLGYGVGGGGLEPPYELCNAFSMNVEIALLLQYLLNFSRTSEMFLINCEINFYVNLVRKLFHLRMG